MESGSQGRGEVSLCLTVHHFVAFNKQHNNVSLPLVATRKGFALFSDCQVITLELLETSDPGSW